SRYGHGDILAVPGIKKDGNQISIEFTITPMRDTTDQIVGVIAILRDVTKRFEEIRALKRKLGQAAKESQAAVPLTVGMGMAYPFFTIGHSTRSIREFVDLLRPQEIKLVVDVRAIPRSRTNPQYNLEEFAKALAEFQ